MQADAILAARDLGRIGAALGDGGDDDGVAGLAGAGRDDDAITDVQLRVGGEATVYCNGTWRLLCRSAPHGDGEQEKANEPMIHAHAEGTLAAWRAFPAISLSAPERRWPSAPCR